MKNEGFEELKDPKGDRAVKTVPPPPQRPLSSSQLFVSSKECNWRLLRDHLKRGGKIEQQEFIKIIELTCAILSNSHLTQRTSPTWSASATR